MYHIVYQTTNLINGKVYVGKHSTKNLDDGYLGSGRALLKAITKYGKENFKREVLGQYQTAEDAYAAEKQIVDRAFAESTSTYNLILGGVQSCHHEPKNPDQAHANKVKANAKLWANPEQRAHICKCLSERNKRFWAEGKFQYHLDWTGKRHKQETKAKMRASHTGKHQGVLNPLYGKVWICHIEQKVSKAVPLNDIEQWLAQGWVKGRIYKDKALNQIQQKASQTHKGTVWVYNIETKTSKMVGTQDLAQWLEQGWVKGRK